MTREAALARAAAAFASGDLGAAERDCRAALALDGRSASALHLLGLVLARAGDAGGAESLLRRSVDLKPRHAEFRVNLAKLLEANGKQPEARVELRTALACEPQSRLAGLALVRLLNRAGAHDEAEAEARRHVAKHPQDAEAWAALAAAERDQGRLDAAETDFRHALALRPSYALARHNLGALLGRMHRAEESLAELERAAALGVRAPELDINRARALIELSRFEEAERTLAALSRRCPERLDAQVLLAELRHMLGDDDYARDLAAAATQVADPAPGLALGDLLRRGGRLAEAEEILRRVRAQSPGVAEIESSLAVVLQEQGAFADALELARSAYARRPEDAAITENLVAILLQCGDADAARPLIGDFRRRAPLDQRWLAYEATAARLSGHDSYHELYDYERFVQAFELAPPPGYDTIDELNRALADRLDARHRLAAHPLDQSLRHGTQSPRDLCHEPDSVIASFLAAVAEPIEAYRARLGFDRDHPFLVRNCGRCSLAACWSVRLHSGGYHVNHVHPEGWISSAYYVSVPTEADDDFSRSGWIKFGEPRMPTPDADAARFVRPHAGMLLLFPSYMWHGTTPLLGDEPRLTIAFDARPTTSATTETRRSPSERAGR